MRHNAFLQMVLFVFLWLTVSCPAETNSPVVRIGVLAHRGKVRCLSDWEPTAAYLQKEIPSYRFEVVPCSFLEIQDRLKARQLDFVLTNPQLYVDLEVHYGLHRIATLIMNRGDLASSEYHGAVFCRAGDVSIRRLADLRGRTVAAVDMTGFGGYAMQARELLSVGVDVAHDLKSLLFLANHDAVVNAVLTGKADAGFARADVRELMIKEGKIQRDALRVLPPPDVLNLKHQHDYGVSTRPYPEWPMAVAHDVPRELAKQVAVELLSMTSDSPAAVAANITGWMVPENYQEVHNCLRDLGMPPYENYGQVTMLGAIRKLWPGLAAVLVVLLLSEILRRSRRQKILKRRVEERTAELSAVNVNLEKEMAVRREAEEKSRKLAAIVESSDDAIYAKDLSGVITSWNKGAERLYGYAEHEAIGQSVSMLIPSDRQGEMTQLMEATLRGERLQHVETVRRKKDGILFDVSLTLSPVRRLDDAIVGVSMIARDITSRKQAEATIRANDQRLESLLRISQHHATSVQELLDFALAEAIALTGSKIGYIYHYEEASRKFILNTWSKDVMKECRVTAPETVYELDKTGIWGEAVRQRKPILINDYKAPDPLKKGCPEGHVELCRFLTIPLFDSEGMIVGVVGVGNKERDYDQADIGQLTLLMDAVWKITDRKRAESALREKTEELDRFFSLDLDLLCIADTDGNFRLLNRAWESTLGYTREELMSKKFLEFVHPDDMAGTLAVVAKLAAQNDVVGFVNRYRCKDGSYRWIEWQSAPAGKLIYAAARDITERKRTEQRLEESLGMNQKMVAALPVGVLAYRATGECILANEMAARIVGTDCDTVLKQNFNKIDSWRQSGMLAMAQEALASRQTLYRQLHVTSSFGRESWLECFMATFIGAGEVNLLLMLHEITELKKAEKALVAAKESAEAANKAKSMFLANMSHEIRTPLNAIIGFGELLSSLKLDEKPRNYVDPIRTAGRSLLRLLNDLLDLSKIEAGRMDLNLSSVDLRLLLEEVEVIFAPRISQKGLKFTRDEGPELPGGLMLDEIRLRQVLVNIVGNALKFTDKGEICVKVRTRFTNEEKSRLELTIAVEDTGIGIPESDQEHIFGAFRQQSEQSSARYGGTGLGLTISRRLVEMMQGTITVKSSVGLGSTFTVCLADVAVVAPNGLARDALSEEKLDISAFRFNGQRVLIVDDVESNRVMLRALLEQVGLNVVEAQDGGSAITLAAEVQPNLVIMDIRMPGMSGFQATAELKKQPATRAIPVMALTASTQEIEPLAVAQAGFAAYLIKPLSTILLLGEIDRLLGGSAQANRPEDGMEGEPRQADESSGQVDLPEEVRAGLMQDVRGLLKGLVVSRARMLAERLAGAGAMYKTASLTTASRRLAKGADMLDVKLMNETLQHLCLLLAEKLQEAETKGR